MIKSIKRIKLILFTIIISFGVMSFINVWAGFTPSPPALNAKNIKRKGTIILQFENYVGEEVPVILDTSVGYFNKFNQPYTISKLKYYIGNIYLKRKDGTKTPFSYDNYFLVDEENNASKKIESDAIIEDEYTSISFSIGVDSLHNCSGAQSGALDPMNGMFWAWNTGYIFFKLEGNSPVSQSPGKLLEFHIGGYKEPNNCLRTVTFDFNNKNFDPDNKGTRVIKIRADVSKVFNSTTKIDFSKISSITDYHNATMIADNYKDMFSVISIDDK